MVLSWHCAHTQLQKLWLAVGGVAALDPRPRLFTVVLTGVALVRVESKEALGQLESANTKSYGTISSESCKGSTAAVFAVGLLRSRSFRESLPSSLLGSLMGSSAMKAAGVHSIHECC